jgi:uncharacterized integral membrane protein
MTDPNQPGYAPQGPPPGQPPGPPGYPPPGQPPAQAPQFAQPPQPTETPPSAQPQQTEPKHAFSLGQILGAILFILLIVFIVENSHNVAIRIIVGPEFHPPVWVVIIIAAVLGAAISALLRYRRRVGARRKQLVREHKSEPR